VFFFTSGLKCGFGGFRAPCGIGGFNRDPFPSPAADLEDQLGKGLPRAGAGLEDLGFRVGGFRVVRFRILVFRAGAGLEDLGSGFKA